MMIAEIFKKAVSKGASDVHLIAGKPPVFRIDGELGLIAGLETLNSKDIEELIDSILEDEQKERLFEKKELDASFETPDKTRFRINCHFEKGKLGMVARIIPAQIPTMEDLLMPEIVYDLTRKKQGLVLLTGPTGCGKSTSLAAMINLINKERSAHIVTLEDPIEFVFDSDKSIIKQRQVGSDTLSFEEGLRHVLRQDPNVIMVGEMRDLETISATLTLAETGHLVFATLHTNNAAQTVDRIIDVFPPYQQDQIRTQLSMVLSGVISQQLIPAKEGGRISAREIMIKSPAISNLVRENKIPQIKSIIQTSAGDLMRTMDQDLDNLYKQGLIDREVANMYMIDGNVK